MSWRQTWTRASEDPEGYWLEQAKRVPWTRAPSKALTHVDGVERFAVVVRPQARLALCFRRLRGRLQGST